MDSNLLKEAIADAKAVRQTALANAKAALEEAFGSRLEAMFAPKLEEETADAVAPAAPTAAPAPAAPALEQEAAVNEADIEEIIAELEKELPQGGAPVPPSPEGVPPAPPMAPPTDPMAADAGAVPPAPPAPMAPPTDPMAAGAPAPAPVPPTPEEEMDEEIDVNELLESLKNEEEEEDEKQEQLDEGVPVNTSGIGGSDNKEPSTDASKSSHIESSGQSVDSATVGTPDYEKKSSKDATVGSKRPNQAKNATKTNLSTPGGALKENTGAPSTPGYPEQAKKTSGGKDATEGVDRPNQAEHATKDNLETVPSPLKEENEQLKTQLKEAEEALNYLRQQLNEINLLNAKLLYTNRLFKGYSMDNQKKMKIIEMFDLAKNVREVKMTYAVIAESLNFGADFQRKTSPKVQNITEGMASKPIAGTAPNKQIIAESAKSEMVSKFQRLAGIRNQQPTTKK